MVLAGVSSASHEAAATTKVNNSNTWRALVHFLTKDPSLASGRVGSGDPVTEATASVQIAVLEELRAPDLPALVDEVPQRLFVAEDEDQAILIHTEPQTTLRLQYLSIRYSERLAEAGCEPSVGSVGDSYDNALAETIIGLFKTEVIHHRGPWRHLEAVEYATLEWVDWFNHRRLLEPIGNVPPAELELAYHRQQSEPALAA